MTGSAVYLHDGSFDGLLTAVALAVKARRPVAAICAVADYGPRLFEEPVTVATDPAQADRLFSYLRGLGGQAAGYCMNGYLSEERQVGIHLLRLVQLCLLHGGRATDLYRDDSIHTLARLARRVSFEAHRLCGLIRFRLLQEGLQYAPFESDHNVIGYLARHFRQRLPERSWILHDLGRQQALYWDTSDLRSIEIDPAFTDEVRLTGEVPEHYLHPGEAGVQALWRMFHGAIANPDRDNPRLQRQLMPSRYWKYLPEMVA